MNTNVETLVSNAITYDICKTSITNNHFSAHYTVNNEVTRWYITNIKINNIPLNTWASPHDTRHFIDHDDLASGLFKTKKEASQYAETYIVPELASRIDEYKYEYDDRASHEAMITNLQEGK